MVMKKSHHNAHMKKAAMHAEKAQHHAEKAAHHSSKAMGGAESGKMGPHGGYNKEVSEKSIASKMKKSRRV